MADDPHTDDAERAPDSEDLDESEEPGDADDAEAPEAGSDASEGEARESEDSDESEDSEEDEESQDGEDGEDAPAEPLPGAGTEDGDTLQRAHDAFERGDFAQVRALTDGLAGSDDVEVARAAAALRKRTESDPAQLVVLLACLVFFLIVAWKYVLS